MRDEIIDRSNSRELNDVCQGTAQWRSVRLRRSVGRICPALSDCAQTDTKRNNGGHSDGKFRPNFGPCPPDLRTFAPISRFLSQVLFPGNARTLAISTGFDPGLDM